MSADIETLGINSVDELIAALEQVKLKHGNIMIGVETSSGYISLEGNSIEIGTTNAYNGSYKYLKLVDCFN